MKLMTTQSLSNKAGRWSSSRQAVRSGVVERRWVRCLGKGLMIVVGVTGCVSIAWAGASQREDSLGVWQVEAAAVAATPLNDHDLEQLRGKFVAPEVTRGNGVILWDERPGETGQGGQRQGASNLSTGTLNHQVTRVEIQRDGRP